MRLLLLVVAMSAMSGCVRPSVSSPLAPPIDTAIPGYWIWFEDGTWRLRTTGGQNGRPHRFQGSVVGLSGSVVDMALSDRSLADRAALVGDALQFDFENAGVTGIDVKVAGGCARFDLYFDGKHRPDRIHLGKRGRQPPRVPFDRCPTD